MRTRRPAELSGGEQRRVALARALAPRPQLVLLDEPFSGLDASLRTETRETIKEALRTEGATAVLVTHDQAEALSLGEEVAVLRAGRLVQRATPEELYRCPVDLEVARFVGAAVVVPGTLDGSVVRCALGVLPIGAAPSRGVAPGDVVDLMVRPEQIQVAQDTDDSSSTDVNRAMRAQVSGHRYYGPDAMVELRVSRRRGPDTGARGCRRRCSATSFPVKATGSGSRCGARWSPIRRRVAAAARKAGEGDVHRYRLTSCRPRRCRW